VCSIADYWPRIKRIPLYPDVLTDDGNAILCRTYDGRGVVRVTKPEFFRSDEDREAAIKFLDSVYSPQHH